MKKIKAKMFAASACYSSRVCRSCEVGQGVRERNTQFSGNLFEKRSEVYKNELGDLDREDRDRERASLSSSTVCLLVVTWRMLNGPR